MECKTIYLTTAGTDTGNFSLYSDTDSYTTAFATGISKAELEVGYYSNQVPDGTTEIRIQSGTICDNYIDAGVPPSPTPTVTPSPTITPTPTPTPSPTPVPLSGFTTEWVVAGDEAARTIALPATGYNTQGTWGGTIYWGDGSSNTFTYWYADPGIIHTYASDGTYRVEVVGNFPGWSFNSVPADKQKFTKVLFWGHSEVFGGFEDLASSFWNCDNLVSLGYGSIQRNAYPIALSWTFRDTDSLTSFPSTLFDNCSDVLNLDSTFNGSAITSIPSGCLDGLTSLTGLSSTFRSTNITSIPSELLDNNTALISLDYTFSNTSVASIPSGLLDNNTELTTLDSTFGYTSITSIPTGLLDNNTELTTLQYLFADTSITSIPSGLLDNLTNLTTLQYLFNSCTSITSIPSGLFDFNTGVTLCRGVFDATSITSIPTGLLDNLTNLTNSAWLFASSPITSIPSGLLDNNTLLTDINWMFNNTSVASIPTGLLDNLTNLTSSARLFGSTPITSIPSGLLDNNILLTDIGSMFYETNISSYPPGMFDLLTGLTDVGGIFYSTSLTGITSGTFDNNVNITQFSNVFGDTPITSIPTGLFDNNINATNFGGSFTNCNLLESVPDALFRPHTGATSFSSTFAGCNALVVSPYIFYYSGETSTRFYDVNVNFGGTFSRDSYSGSTQGTAPNLWDCDFGKYNGGWINSINCFSGSGNTITSLSNCNDIPSIWGSTCNSPVTTYFVFGFLNIGTCTAPGWVGPNNFDGYTTTLVPVAGKYYASQQNSSFVFWVKSIGGSTGGNIPLIGPYDTCEEVVWP